jgi:hypothetical protein
MATCIASTEASVTIKEGKLDVNSNICRWAPPTYGDTGESALHAVLSVVAFAVAVWSAYEQMRIFNMRYQIANGYADIAQEGWTRFERRYRPLEALMVAECLGEGPVEPDYEAARSRDAALAAFGREQARTVLGRLDGLCPGPSRLRRMEVDEAALQDDLINFGFRDAETNALNEDDMRFNRRAGLLNLGRDLVSRSAAYGRTVGAILAEASAAQAATTAGAVHMIGYLRNRDETSYPNWLAQSYSPGAVLGGSATGSPVTGG